MPQQPQPSTGDDESLQGTVDLEHPVPGLAVVSLRGEHDLSTVPELAGALERAAAHSNVVVDFSECGFIDSSVIAVLIRSARTVRARGEQLLAVIPPESRNVARVAHMVHLSELVPVHSSRDDALARLGGTDPSAAGDPVP
jgi:anti-anti-sigma factor